MVYIFNCIILYRTFYRLQKQIIYLFYIFKLQIIPNLLGPKKSFKYKIIMGKKALGYLTKPFLCTNNP